MFILTVPNWTALHHNTAHIKNYENVFFLILALKEESKKLTVKRKRRGNIYSHILNSEAYDTGHHFDSSAELFVGFILVAEVSVAEVNFHATCCKAVTFNLEILKS